MIQPNQIKLTSQTKNHVEITKILRTSQHESRIVDCYCQSWFLKRKLNSNLCQVLIHVNYMRDWQSDFKKNLQQDSIVKRIILMTQKMEFSVKNLFNKKEQICSFMQICSHLLKKFLMEKFFFVHWFVQVNRQTTTVKKKIIYFLKNYVACFFTIFEKVLAICKFFPLGV